MSPVLPDPWVPIGISAVSLATSTYVLWRTQLSGARLHIVPTGRIEFSRDPRSAGAVRPAMGLSLLLSNTGARVGYVSDVALAVRVSGSSKEPVLFRGVFESLDDRINFVQGPPPPPQWLPFRAFAVGSQETVLKRFFLVLADDGAMFGFGAGAYEIALYTKQGRTSPKWHRGTVETVQLDQADLEAMKPQVTPVEGGGQFVNLKVQSKLTALAQASVDELKHFVR